ncbi:MAG: T9SS type A sorting domain-containing protein, partial [Saprospiraceae bacterium]|nr:T9SS type A sorting domain-containing protein [Saprospiraceae bacterium]
CWVVKLDASGAIQWQRTLGGTDADGATDIRQTSDGGYILGGQTESDDGDVSGHHNNRDLWVVKLGPTGTIEWQRALGGSGNENMGSVRETTDGGYFVCGTAGSSNGDVVGNHGVVDIWVLKLGPTGAIQWQKTLGGSAIDFANAGLQTTDGGYVVAGYTKSTDGDLSFSRGEEDVWIIKLTATGTIEWSNTFGGNKQDLSTSIRQVADGGYIVTGATNSTDGDVTNLQGPGSTDIWLLKITTEGTLEWEKTLGGAKTDIATSIEATNDGGFILLGNSESSDGQLSSNYGSLDCWVVRLDPTGNIIWQKSIGGTNDDQGFSIFQTTDGGFILNSGVYSNDIDVSGNHGNADFWVVKLSSGITGVEDAPAPESSALSIFPNPASGLVRITLDREAIPVQAVLTDMSGKMLYAKNIDNAGYLDVSDLPGGVYALTVTDQNGIRYSGKVVR